MEQGKLTAEAETLGATGLKDLFDQKTEELNNKEYLLELSNEDYGYLINTFLPNLGWKGYECYAIEKIDEEIRRTFSKSKSYKELVNKEVIQAVFHFLKNYEGKGVMQAKSNKRLSDIFAKPMADINKDYADVKEIAHAMEIQEQKDLAKEQGIELETTPTEGPKA